MSKPEVTTDGHTGLPWYCMHNDGNIYATVSTGQNTAKIVVVARGMSLADAALARTAVNAHQALVDVRAACDYLIGRMQSAASGRVVRDLDEAWERYASASQTADTALSLSRPLEESEG